MTSIVLIDKNSSIKQTKVKNLTKDTLYKKWGFKVSGGFELRTIWKVNIEDDKMNIELWSRDYGKAGTENKYDFPPPVDTALYFGTCAILRVDDEGDITDLSVSMWNKIYEKLFGGFEDIADGDDDDSEDELASVPKKMKTKAGYLKDGFVVEDGDDSDSDSNSDSDSDSDGENENNEFINIGGNDEDDDGEDDSEDDDGDDDSEGGSELDEDVYQYSSDENS